MTVRSLFLPCSRLLSLSGYSMIERLLSSQSLGAHLAHWQVLIVLPRCLSWPPSGHTLPMELTGHAHLEPTWPASGYHSLGTEDSEFLCPNGLQPAPRAHAVFLPGSSFNRRCQSGAVVLVGVGQGPSCKAFCATGQNGGLKRRRGGLQTEVADFRSVRTGL